MTDDRLIDAMQELDDDLLREAMSPPAYSVRRAARRWLAFAAAGAAVFAAGLLVFRAVSAPKPATPPTVTASDFAAAAMPEHTTAPEPPETEETTSAVPATEPPCTEAPRTTAQSGTEAPAGPKTGAPDTAQPRETEPPGTQPAEPTAEPRATEKTGLARLFGDGNPFWDRFPFLGALLGGGGSSADAPTGSGAPEVPGGDTPPQEIPETESTGADPQTARALRGNAAFALTTEPDGTLRTGDTVTVTVFLENAQSLAYLMLSVRYDPDALRLEEAETETVPGWTGEAGAKEAGHVKYGGFARETVNTGRTALCTLTFTATAAAPTDTQLTFCVERYGVCEEDEDHALNIASAFPEQAFTLHLG